MTEPIPAYVYKAQFAGLHDADTIWLALDHGKFPTSRSVTEAELRIRNLWCPELDKPGGIEAAQFVADLLINASRIVAQTYKASFARTMADVWVDGAPLADLVIAAGHGSSTR